MWRDDDGQPAVCYCYFSTPNIRVYQVEENLWVGVEMVGCTSQCEAEADLCVWGKHFTYLWWSLPSPLSKMCFAGICCICSSNEVQLLESGDDPSHVIFHWEDSQHIRQFNKPWFRPVYLLSSASLWVRWSWFHSWVISFCCGFQNHVTYLHFILSTMYTLTAELKEDVWYLFLCGSPSALSTTWNTKASDSNQDLGECMKTNTFVWRPGFLAFVKCTVLMFCKCRCCGAKHLELGEENNERLYRRRLEQSVEEVSKRGTKGDLIWLRWWGDSCWAAWRHVPVGVRSYGHFSELQLGWVVGAAAVTPRAQPCCTKMS